MHSNYVTESLPLFKGEHLRMCPQGPTCCTIAMEGNLAGLSAQETEGLIREAGRSLQATFNNLHRSFDSK